MRNHRQRYIYLAGLSTDYQTRVMLILILILIIKLNQSRSTGAALCLHNFDLLSTLLPPGAK